MKKFFIHIGTHKTGSTTIKSSLALNKSLLKSKGLLYIDTKWSYDIMRLKHDDQALKKRICDNFSAQLEKENANKRCDVVIAAEKFSGDPYSGYDNASIIAVILYAVSQGYKPVIIVYLRRQDTFIESLYTQSVHQGSSLEFQEFLEERELNNYDWSNLLTSYQKVFGDESLIVRSYDYFNKNRENGGILKDFYDLIGYSEAYKQLASQTKTDVNIGYSPAAVQFARMANKYVNEQNQKAFRRALQLSNHKKKGDSYSYFEGNERSDFFKLFEEKNKKVANLYLPENQRIFLCEIENRKESINPVNDQELLVQIITNYMIYAENKPSAEPKEITKNLMRYYFPKLYKIFAKKG